MPARFRATRPNALVSRTLFRRDATTTTPSTILEASLTKSTSTSVGAETFLKTTRKSITPDTYRELRTRDRYLVSNLTPTSYFDVLGEALFDCPDLANLVVRDIMEVYRGKDSNRIHMLRTILTEDFSPLDLAVVSSVLQHLADVPGGLDFLSPDSVERLIGRVAYTQHPTQVERQFFQLICPLISDCATRHKAPGGAHSTTYYPPRIIKLAFRFLRQLLNMSQKEEALPLFQALLDTGHIPREMIQGLDSSSNDFNVIIFIALAKASLHWNWNGLTILTLTDILDLPRIPHQSIIDLNLDTIYALLDAPTPNGIRACRQLICKVHPHAPVPNSVIRQFYTSAMQLSQTDEAEELYHFTRTSSILDEHQYSPPHGLALSWLMYHLTTTSRRTYLSRQLVSEVVENNLPLPLHYRARFLSKAAAQGYATFARTLWERYSVGNDKHVVVGNSALMLRMISLFANLRRRSGTSQRFNDQNFFSEDGGTLETHTDDLTSFMTQVLQEYRAHHTPLVKAPHPALTSLARACFILGKYSEGLEVFRVLLERKEIPDMYDVNVALTAVAKAKPRLAARMIDRMIEKGLTPDAVTYGTVMHHALINNDSYLVYDMMEGIRGLKGTRLTLQSIAGVIRATVSSGTGGQEGLRDQLQSVVTMIETLNRTTTFSSPQVGKYLVSVSLRANDFILAYKFWYLLLRESAEWDDREQQLLRRRIAEMIRGSESLDTDQIGDMLAQLDQ
jgi:hypothetical protein